MQKKLEDTTVVENWEQLLSQSKNLRRHKARSLLDESTLYKTACLNYFEFKDVPQVILQMLRKEEEMSQDSLLGPGMMLESVSNMGSFDNLKTSQSLGELGFIDLKSVQVIGLDDQEVLTPQDKALKFLKLTWSDVRKAQDLKSGIDSSLYSVDNETWDRVVASSTNVNKHKTPRTEVFIHEISQEESIEVVRNNKPFRKKSLELKFGMSLFDFFREKYAEHDDDQDEDQLSESSSEGEEEMGGERRSSEEEEEEIEKNSLFMSNIREEIPVNRIRLDLVPRATKGNAYAKLYIQDFMSVIGPEVFDRATKLPKVTSLTKVTRRQEMRMSASMPNLSKKSKKKINFDDEAVEKGEVTPKSDVEVVSISFNSDYQNEFNSTEDVVFTSSRQPFKNFQQLSDAENQELVLTKSLLQPASHEDEEKSIKSENLIKMVSYTSNRKFIDVSSKEDMASLISVLSQNENNTFSVLSERESKNYEQTEESFKKRGDFIEIRDRGSCFRQRKIMVKRRPKIKTKTSCKRKLSRPIKVLINKSSNSFDSERGQVSSSRTVSDQEGKRSSHEKRIHYFTPDSFASCSDDTSGNEPFFNINNKQIYFLTELLQRPLFEVLATYYDLKMKILLERKANPFVISTKNSLFGNYNELKEFEKISSLQFEQKKKKGWKSKVLETASNYGTSKGGYHLSSFRFKNNLILRELNDELSIRGSSSSKQSFLTEKTSVLFNASRQLKDKVDFSVIDKGTLGLPQRSSSLSLLAWSCDSLPGGISTENYSKEGFRLFSESNSLDRYFSLLHLENTTLTPTNNENEEVLENEEKSSDSQARKHLVPPTFWYESDDCHNDFTSCQTNEREIWDENRSTSSTFEVQTEIIKREEECSQQTNEQDNLDILSTPETLCNTLEDFPCSKESDESFSLYYSKAADLTSPLMDMKRFIYPDHIHYSYKHVKKKGFDVDISGGLPLLVRESLTMNTPVHMKKVSSPKNLASKITRRPMDLSFASTNAFSEWQSNDQVGAEAVVKDSKTTKTSHAQTVEDSHLKDSEVKSLNLILSKGKNTKKIKWKKGLCDDHNLQKNELIKKKSKLKTDIRNYRDINDLDSIKDYPLIKKLLKMQDEKNIRRDAEAGKMEQSRTPIQISSTQLHSNKGRINSTYNPALFLQENKARNAGEKRKTETQEERTKKMFARLEREVLLQSKNVNKTFEKPMM